MPAVTSVPPSGNTDIDGLLFEVKWSVVSFTFSFPTSASFYGPGFYSSANEPANNFEALNSTQRSVVRTILNSYASVAAISFSELTESATVHADLRLSDLSFIVVSGHVLIDGTTSGRTQSSRWRWIVGVMRRTSRITCVS